MTENRQETQTQTVRIGRRTWVVERTWQNRGTRWVRVTGTRTRRQGSDQWRDGRSQVEWGTVTGEVWS